MKKTFLLVCFSAVMASTNFAQWEYRVDISPEKFDQLPALHSYVFAQQNQEYLIIGGRKDGIHPRQPFASFSEADKNTTVYVINTQTKEVWQKAIDALGTDLKEQLGSTNMNFHQEADTLYIIGGYGYSASAADHKTYPFLTTVSVSGLIQAVKNNQSISAYFKQLKDDKFAVTGGHLAHLNHYFYLVGGHRFDGRYNPMGNPTYTQAYTHEVRKFKVNNSSSSLNFTDYTAIHDESHLRRRDYNLVPQIFEDGTEGFLISSGVFQKNADLPFLYPVQVHENGIKAITDFNQYLSHYHSASVALYSKDQKTMYSLFLGGLSQYDYENEKLIKDDRVPFVKTISLVAQEADGNYTEYKLNQSMPGLLGASAEFLFDQHTPQIAHEIIDLDAFSGDTLFLGYIYGGIESSSANPFSDNTISLTNANPTMYRVQLIKDAQNAQSLLKRIPDVKVFPNPNNTGKVQIQFPFEIEKVKVFLRNNQGQIVQENILSSTENEKTFSLEIKNNLTNGMYYLQLVGPDAQSYRKPIILSR